MKHFAVVLVFIILLKCSSIFAQSDSAITNICGHIQTIKATKLGSTYYLKIGDGKNQKVGNSLVKGSLAAAYRKVLNSLLSKSCGNYEYNQVDFVLFVNSFASYVANEFSLPPNNPYPVLVDSFMLDQKLFLGIIKTTNNDLILFEKTSPLTVRSIFSWNSSENLISFDPTVFRDNLLQQFLPECLLLQRKASKSIFPQFYLLRNWNVPNYELISSYHVGTGNHTGIIIPSQIGDTIVASGAETKLIINGTKLDVTPVKNTVGVVSAAAMNNSKSTLSSKGPLIEHEQVTCNKGSSYNIAAYVYIPSPSDSIIFSLKFPRRQIPDTVMPMDFKSKEVEAWVASALPKGQCVNSQSNDFLYTFLLACAQNSPNQISKYISSMQKDSSRVISTANQAKTTTMPLSKIDSSNTISRETQSNSPKNANKNDSSNIVSGKPQSDSSKNAKADSSAKYSILNNITLLNAFNFNFSGKLTSSYLGLFNIFAPDRFTKKNINKHKNVYWGFIAGIEKINYGNANSGSTDSSQNAYLFQYVLKNPLDYNSSTQKINPGAEYYYQYNKYTLTSKSTSWSFYIEPTLRSHLIPYDSTDPKVGLYWHFHAELLANYFSGNISMQNLHTDSSNYGLPNSPALNRINYYLPAQYTTNSTIITGNFGLGFSFYAAPFKKDTSSHFYFQFTTGASINSPNFTNLTELQSKNVSGENIVSLPSINGALANQSQFEYTYTHIKAFYLFRAIFSQSLSNKAELVAGMTIRGLFPSQTPQYAAYLGLNLDLNILADLFSSK